MRVPCAVTCSMRPSDWRAVSCIFSDGSHRDGGYIVRNLLFFCSYAETLVAVMLTEPAVDDALCTVFSDIFRCC